MQTNHCACGVYTAVGICAELGEYIQEVNTLLQPVSWALALSSDPQLFPCLDGDGTALTTVAHACRSGFPLFVDKFRVISSRESMRLHHGNFCGCAAPHLCVSFWRHPFNQTSHPQALVVARRVVVTISLVEQLCYELALRASSTVVLVCSRGGIASSWESRETEFILCEEQRGVGGWGLLNSQLVLGSSPYR